MVMPNFEVSIDKVPEHCTIQFVFCGPITTAYARNTDTKVEGPLVDVNKTLTLTWADLDPHQMVSPPAPPLMAPEHVHFYDRVRNGVLFCSCGERLITAH